MHLRQRGQASFEYVGVIAVTAVALVVAGPAISGAGLASAIHAQMARALCRVRSGDCERDRSPCVLRSRLTSSETTARVAVLRLRGGTTLLRERLSDGSERVTSVDRGGIGVGLAVGGDVAAGDWVLGGRLDAAVEARGAHGRTWHLTSAGAADELVRRLTVRARLRPRVGMSPRRSEAPPADVVFGERGLETSVGAWLERTGLTLAAEDVFSSRVDRRTGERTYVVRRRNELTGVGGLTGPFAAEAAFRRDQRYAIVTDRVGRPRDLVITDVRRLQMGARLPGPLRSLVARGGVPVREGKVVEIERHLDLTEPENRAAAGAFLRAVRSPSLQVSGEAVAVSDALRRRLEVAGVVQARVYALAATHSGGHAGIDVGVSLGGGHERVTESLTLSAATVRGPSGAWSTREDCHA